MGERVILHSDLNNFYASVECLYNPKIRNLPVAVCGNAEARHGIVLAKNQIAKGYGIITGESTREAQQKCPNLVIVPPHFDLYLKYSKLAREIYYQYTDQVEAFGIDENWLDVTGSVHLFGTGEQIAEEIRQRIWNEMGVTVSIGVSFNKIIAKLGSDMKKPNAITVIPKDRFRRIVWPLPVDDLLYVGRSTAKKLKNSSIKTIGQLARYNTASLVRMLGKWGVVIQRFANGEDDSPVVRYSDKSEPYIKSVGNSLTTPRDLVTIEDVKLFFYMLSESVAARLRQHGFKATTVQIYVRDKNLVSCERQGPLKYPTYIAAEIAEKAIEIFKQKFLFQAPLRTIGVRGTGLVDADSAMQLDLFTNHEKREKLEKMEHTMDYIRGRFGHDAIQRGLLLTDDKVKSMDPKTDHIIHPVGYF